MNHPLMTRWAHLVAISALALSGATGCTRSPRAVDDAYSYLASGHEKKVKLALTYYENHPEEVDEAVGAALRDVAREGTQTDKVIRVLAASRPEMAKDVVDEQSMRPKGITRGKLRRLKRELGMEEEKAASKRKVDEAPKVVTQVAVVPARTDDVVKLKGGGRVVGKVLVEDKKEIIVQLADGTSRHVVRGEIDSVRYAGE